MKSRAALAARDFFVLMNSSEEHEFLEGVDKSIQLQNRKLDGNVRQLLEVEIYAVHLQQLDAEFAELARAMLNETYAQMGRLGLKA
jgi:hypothetical protein